MRSVLIGLGLDPAEAQTIAFMPLEIPGAVEGPIFSGLKAAKIRRATTRDAGYAG